MNGIRKRLIRNGLVSAAILGLIVVLAAWIAGGRLISRANRNVELPASFPAAEFSIESASGSMIAGWSLSAEGSNAVVILFHPIRGNRLTMLSRAKLLLDAGYSVVMVDLQAHGESPGNQITFGHLEKHDVAATVEYTREKFPNSKIAIIGWSLGGASALLASPRVDAMVLESVYPTVSEALHNRLEMRIGIGSYVAAPLFQLQLPLRLGISTDDLRPIDFVGEIGCPLLVFAGDKDLHTPIEESERMFASASEPKTLAVFAGAAHVDLFAYDQNRYSKTVLKFLSQHLLDQ